MQNEMSKEVVEFWGEPISVYTDADALEDGCLTDISDLGVKFNGRIVNRIASEAAIVLNVKKEIPMTLMHKLSFMTANCTFDGAGSDAWGIFQNQLCYDNQRFWLIPNEVEGYTIMLPNEY